MLTQLKSIYATFLCGAYVWVTTSTSALKKVSLVAEKRRS